MRAQSLDIVIVTWNHGSLVDRCLASISAADGAATVIDRVIIVDNASEVPYVPPPGCELPGLSVLGNSRNVGFAAACNQGAACGDATYILFLNPDTSIGKESLVSALDAFASDAYEHTAIIGLPLVDENGELQATCGRELTVSRIFTQVTGLTTIASGRFPGFRLPLADHRRSGPVDFVSGACLFIRRRVFEQLGGFEGELVVYLEDADLALRARHLGWDVHLIAAAPVMHESGWASGRKRPLRLAHSWRSLIVYAWKHFSVLQAVAVTATVLTLAPLARVAGAALRGSVRDLIDAFRASACLWYLLCVRSSPQSHSEPIAARSRPPSTT
ncbi:MAG TPA: glycosyltransferase family 2 protein [Thermoanaerobaculia bacterium]